MMIGARSVLVLSIFHAFFIVEIFSWTSSSYSLERSLKHNGQLSKKAFALFSSSGNNDSEESKEEAPLRNLKDLLMPNPKCNPTQMSPTSLAYIGDSVFELFVRSRYVWPTRRTTDLQKIVVDKVRAETQSKMFRNIMASDSFQLTKEEQIIVSRGRNAGSSSKGRKRGPKRLYASGDKDEGGGPSAYQDSTAFEALIGYMYITDEERCAELMRMIGLELDQMDEK